MDMDAALWSRLPSELVEKVLSFLPVSDLCRYRSVCRKWNKLICNPAFATVHAQNGKRRGASFIAMELQGLETLTWCLLDLNARRWYTFRDDRNIIARHCNDPFDFGLAAMDGGLVCRFSKTEPPELSIFVHDLLGHTVKNLPLTRLHLTSRKLPKAHMFVDSTSHHFTIFLLNRGFDLENLIYTLDITFEERMKIMNDPLMRIYNSATGEWRSASNPREHYLFSDVVSMVMCQGLLYALMDQLDQWIAICYNPAEDAWKCTHFCLSKRDTQYPRLIAITTRLFVASWRVTSEVRGGGYEFDFEVSEIIIPQMTPETLFKLPMPDVIELLEVKTRNLDFIDSKGWCDPLFVGLKVNGVDNALFVQSLLSDKAKVFDLDTRSWDHGIPEHPLWHLCSDSGDALNKIAKQMNLLLPNSLEYFI